MHEFTSLADILLWPPCNDGKKVLEIKHGFGDFNRGATSLHIRKNGSYMFGLKLFMQL
jgi:hypothetical protein